MSIFYIPASKEDNLRVFIEWLAKLYKVKVTARIDKKDGTYCELESNGIK